MEKAPKLEIRTNIKLAIFTFINDRITIIISNIEGKWLLSCYIDESPEDDKRPSVCKTFNTKEEVLTSAQKWIDFNWDYFIN